MVQLGEKVRVIKGEHEGKRAKLTGTDGFFCHLLLLTKSGKPSVHGRVTLHRSAIVQDQEKTS